ncbi:hypothetical protein RFI_24601 [Reticulomyxa filosa]|uniref:BTB domain-containing protein n=1 Tax=Reticulomyxa filosa TaxID=46433 RepID=X6MFU3_RETFI|nr:hypothetical protein RFI_24601 [Reticulomyxa filosa]|eukprot:ETO12774.1 hypothetical protein RFI_24601 [Reticulomyxa filosa]
MSSDNTQASKEVFVTMDPTDISYIIFGVTLEERIAHGSIVRINDMSPKCFDFIRHVCYGVKAKLDEEMISEVLYISNKYLIKGLKKRCVKFILARTNMESIVHILNELYEYQLDSLWKDILFQDQWLGRFIESKEFTQLKSGAVKLFLENCCDVNEELLWTACVKWSQAQENAEKCFYFVFWFFCYCCYYYHFPNPFCKMYHLHIYVCVKIERGE